MNIYWALAGLVIFVGFDAWAYKQAKFPERTENILFEFPGGGFAAYFILGKDK